MWNLLKKIIQSALVIVVTLIILMPYILGTVLHSKYELVDQQLLDDLAQKLRENKLVDDDYQLLLTKESYKQGYFSSKALVTISVLGDSYQALRKEGIPTDFQFSITADHLFDIRIKAKLETRTNPTFYQRVFLEPDPYVMRANVSVLGDITINEDLSTMSYLREGQQYTLAHASGNHHFKRWELSKLSYVFPNINVQTKGNPLPSVNIIFSGSISNIEDWPNFGFNSSGITNEGSRSKKRSRKNSNILDSIALSLTGVIDQKLIDQQSALSMLIKQSITANLANKENGYYRFEINLKGSTFTLSNGEKRPLTTMVMGLIPNESKKEINNWFFNK